jgi:hypothetical protein
MVHSGGLKNDHRTSTADPVSHASKPVVAIYKLAMFQPPQIENVAFVF